MRLEHEHSTLHLFTRFGDFVFGSSATFWTTRNSPNFCPASTFTLPRKHEPNETVEKPDDADHDDGLFNDGFHHQYTIPDRSPKLNQYIAPSISMRGPMRSAIGKLPQNAAMKFSWDDICK